MNSFRQGSRLGVAVDFDSFARGVDHNAAMFAIFKVAAKRLGDFGLEIVVEIFAKHLDDFPTGQVSIPS